MTRLMTLFSTCLALLACGGPTGSPDAGVDPQNPPTTGRAAIEAWLAAGVYKQWKCEPASHDARSPSPHGKNRICSNAKLSAAGTGEYPVDSAGVKELLDTDGTTLIGYAVYRHVSGGAGGDSWYWYERVPANHPAPHDANGVVADGLGGAGPPRDICVGCHQGAGSDAMHSGHDMVYTQVR